MILEIVLSFVAGILAGTFTGLFPGIHINLIAATLTAASSSHIQFLSPLSLSIFIVSMSITHSFLDFIPSIYLGAPEEDSFLSVLPGHKFLKKGLGHYALVLSLYGSLIAIGIFLIFTPVFIWLIPPLVQPFQKIMPFLLIFISFYMIFREKRPFTALLVFMLSGATGLLSFSLPIKEPLLPLLSGLFGLSGLFISVSSKIQIPKQKITPLKKITIKKKSLFRAIIASIVSAPICSFLPGLGSGHAAVIGSEIIPQTKKGFLVLVGSINTIILSLSFITIYSIGKSRSGVAAAVLEIVKGITLSQVLWLIIAIVLAGTISFFWGIYLSKLSAKHITKISYSKLSIITSIILIAVNLLFTNWIGILVLFTSASLGVYCILSNSRRINLMGSLILPVIVFYLSLNFS